MHGFWCKFIASVLGLVFFIAENTENAAATSRGDKCLAVIPESYDRHLPPQNGDQATSVFLRIEVLDLDEINEESMDFRLHAFIDSAWKDSRLTRNNTNLHKDCLDHIWNPDFIFEEAKIIIETGQNNAYFVIRDGYFYLSQRYSFKVSCTMNFQTYPFDEQHCIFSIACMATDDSVAVLKWFDDEQSPYKDIAAAFRLTKELDPLQFTIESPTAHSEVRHFQYSNFSYLLANFTLVRRLTGSVVNYYMPSALLVVVSWMTFWLEQDAAPERVSLIMTALLTICTQGAQYKQELPKVNYITAMDIWYFICISMLFGTLLEFAFSYNTHRKKMKEKSITMAKVCVPYCKCSRCLESPNTLSVTEDSKGTKDTNSSSTKLCERFVHFVTQADLDSLCKVLFPSFFLIFNIVYWSFYYQHKTVSSWKRGGEK